MEESGIRFLLSRPAALGIAFEQPGALLLLLMLPLFFRFAPSRFRLAAFIRTVAAGSLVFAIAGFELTARLPDQRRSVVAVVDRSESMPPDSAAEILGRLRELQGALAPADEFGLVSFAAAAQILRPPSRPAPLDAIEPPGERRGTNVSAALEVAASLLPAEGDRRLLLYSDGNETDGDARVTAASLAASGIRIDVVPPGGLWPPDVAVRGITAPEIVAEDTPFPLRFVTETRGGGRDGLVKIFLDGVLVDSTPLHFDEGTATIEVPYRLSGRGTHRIAVEVSATPNVVTGNDRREALITVAANPHILFVSPFERSVVADVLSRKQIRVESIRPGDFPVAMESLATYQGVVFEDVPARDLPAGALVLLDRWVRELGGGFILSGGTDCFGDPGWLATPLQKMLPVTLEPKRPNPNLRDPLALFLIIDRSNSMGYNSRLPTLHDGEKLRYAKEAALAVVRQLKDHDLVGLIAFDSEAHPIADLRSLKENRSVLERDIPRLVENGGTDFYDALDSARGQLVEARATRRHMVVLTDGDTNRAAGEHYPLIDRIADAGISVTTIRIGENDVNLKLLQDISERTGGQFYHVEDATMLPDLLLRDATRAMGPLSDKTVQFFPEGGERSELLRGLTVKVIPPLTGYAYSRARRGADIVLHINRLDDRDPLLAVWQYGLGRVAAFTASTAAEAERWPAWDEFSRFWSQLAHWSVRDETPFDWAVEVRRRAGVSELQVRTFSPVLRDVRFLARIDIDPTRTIDVPLAPTGVRRHSARMPDLAPGAYEARLIATSTSSGVIEQPVRIVVPEVDDPDLREFDRIGPNLPLLEALAASTGGKVSPTQQDLKQRVLGAKKAAFSFDRIFLAASLLLFLGDVAIRRLGITKPRVPWFGAR